MKRKYELEVNENHVNENDVKKICQESNKDYISNEWRWQSSEFSRKSWPDKIILGMGSKKLLEKVYSTYTSQKHLMTQFINIYDNQECTPEIMCKLFSLVLQIEKNYT